jgi:hypothetical protein
VKTILILILLLGSVGVSFSQAQQKKATPVPTFVVPDSATISTTSLSNYFKQTYASDSDRVKAIFTWVSSNIDYDVDNMFLLTYGDGKDEKITKALKTRAAICEGYAELFNELCYKAGIQSKVIEGYTKYKGMVDYIPHAWVAAKVDKTWYMYDPTWSSGYVSNNKFTKGFTYKYYKVKPEELIKTHMPFDPMDQLLKHPLTSKDFYDGNFALNTSRPVFNYEDTLTQHIKLSEIDQVRNIARRIEANGVKSSMILQMLQHFRNKELYFKNVELNKQADSLNIASTLANDAVIEFNRFIEFKNKQFTPKKEDKEIERMLVDVQSKVNNATLIIARVKTDEPSFKVSISQINTIIEDLQKRVTEEKIFVDKYLKTKKLLRPLIFTRLG